jgi:hypothetical protein
METNTYDDAVQDLDSSEIPAGPCPFAAAIVPAADPADVQSVQRLLKSVARSLATADSSKEVKAARDQAEVLRVFLRNIDAGLEAQNKAAELKLLAERRLGQELAGLEKAAGGRPSDKTGNTMLPLSHDGPPTLAELGIKKIQSSRWQTIASVPEDEFKRYVAEVKDRSKELTTAGLIRFAKRLGNVAQRACNSGITELAENNAPTTKADDDHTVAEIVNPRADGNSIAGMAREERSRPDAMTEPDDVASVGKASELLKTPEPDEHDYAGKGPAPVGRDRSRQVTTPAELQIDADVDPYGDREPLWLRGGLDRRGSPRVIHGGSYPKPQSDHWTAPPTA